ncbi:tetratricopeptide repeat protein [Paludibaculum fermentans]|uniref:Tetratricopeptide repeat protein n=1 Tax=Paludibaculum fermentans TaxID=1473598 RepID=A0A7S7NK66_PALFE|nr:tetratricopeptide repeat protein [Paludibaculum fermentans]QOY85130.1 tetratricopeptide repeat protein [Paludibaculum fermentans]
MRTAILCCTVVLAGSVFAQPPDPAELSRRARDHMAAGRYGAAVPYYEELVKAMPGNPGLRLNLAMALHLSGNDEKAVPQFELVLKQQPNTLPALMLLGASQMRLGHPDKAVGPLEKAMAQAPEDLEGRAMLADALIMLDRFGAAIPHLRKLAAATPQNPKPWYALGKAYEAVSQQAFDELEKKGLDSPWWLMLAAEVRLKLNRNTAAYALYKAVIEKQPQLRGAHAGLAEVYRRTNHPDWAQLELAKEKALPPQACTVPSSACEFARGRFEKALALASAGKTLESLYWQSKAANELARLSLSELEKLPPSVESHQVLAELYRNQGRNSDSLNEWRAALALSPGDPRLEMEVTSSLYVNRDYAAAERNARDMLARDPEVPELQFILGDSLVNQQHLEQALPALEKAVQLRRDYPAAHAVLGRVFLQLGRGNEAIPHLKAALPADTDGSLHFQLSRAYQDAGQAGEAAAVRKAYQEIRKSTAVAEIEIAPPQP